MTSTLQQKFAKIIGVAFALSLTFGLAASAAPSASDDVGRSMLDYSFERASTEFYKKTTAQSLLDGAVAGMRRPKVRGAVINGDGFPFKCWSKNAST